LQHFPVDRVAFELVFLRFRQNLPSTTPGRHLLNSRRCLHASATIAAPPRFPPLKLTKSIICFPAPSRARFQHTKTTTPQSIPETKRQSTRRPLQRLPPPLSTHKHRQTKDKTTESPFSPPTSEHQGEAMPELCTLTTQPHSPPLPPSLPALPRPQSKRHKKPKPNSKTPSPKQSQTTPKPCTPSPSTN